MAGVSAYAASKAAILAMNRSLAREMSGEQEGTLSIATTHTQARYVLPPTIKRFIEAYPDVALHDIREDIRE